MRLKNILLFLTIIFCLGCTSWKDNPELKQYIKINKAEFYQSYTYLEDENHVFENISFEEMIKLFDLKKSCILYIGGSWCPNCQAAVPYINFAAKELDINIIYNFDTRISAEKKMTDDIRKCNNDDQIELYKILLNKLNYRNPYGETAGSTNLDNIRVPAVIAIKDGIALEFLIEEYIYDGTKDFFGQEYKEEYLEALNILMIKIKA